MMSERFSVLLDEEGDYGVFDKEKSLFAPFLDKYTAEYVAMRLNEGKQDGYAWMRAELVTVVKLIYNSPKTKGESDE